MAIIPEGGHFKCQPSYCDLISWASQYLEVQRDDRLLVWVVPIGIASFGEQGLKRFHELHQLSTNDSHRKDNGIYFISEVCCPLFSAFMRNV